MKRGLQLAQNCPDYKGIRFTEGQLYQNGAYWVGVSRFTWFGISISGWSSATMAVNLDPGTRCMFSSKQKPKPFVLGTPVAANRVVTIASLDFIKFSLEQATKAQSGNRCIALLFLQPRR